MIKNNKFIIVTLMCISVLALTGCSNDNNKSDYFSTENIEQGVQLTEAAQKIEDSIVEGYNDEFTKIKLEYKIPDKKLRREQKPPKQNYYYGMNVIYTGNMITDENIKSIEYSLSNCVGTFMDSNKDNEELKVMNSIIEIENKPYMLNGSDQSEVYFSIYYYYNSESDSMEQILERQKCIKDLRITANITFEDGTKETRNYGVVYASKYSSDVANMNFCLLE